VYSKVRGGATGGDLAIVAKHGSAAAAAPARCCRADLDLAGDESGGRGGSQRPRFVSGERQAASGKR
jgi:hypothetical protein